MKESEMKNDDKSRRLKELLEKARLDEASSLAAAEEKGWKKGLEMGMKEGLELGIKEGLEEAGRQQVMREIACRLMREGLTHGRSAR